MNKFFLILALFSLFANPLSAKEQYGNLLNCDYFDISEGDHKGQSFLNFIRYTVKPDLDTFATKGYKVTDGQTLVDSLELVDKKVRRQVIGAVKGNSRSEKLRNLKTIGDELKGTKANLYNLHDKIAKTGYAKDRFKLSTYVGLASCGGTTIKLADDNYAYNVHYGTGSVKKDKLTGRSFGASRIYHATDSSYTHYLRTLENYVTKSPGETKDFMQTVMETLTNTQPLKYSKVNDYGDAVLTDFFAIWTAEQTRNLMDGHISLHWDAALLQVTLLSAFHAGQDKIKLFYKDPASGKTVFTGTTYKLAWPRKDHVNKTCNVDLDSRKEKPASLTDYIGIHYAVYQHCGRSGINMSRNEWKKLSRAITAHLMSSKEGREKIANVRKYIDDVVDLTKNERGKKYKYYEKDILRELSRFLISERTPHKVKNWYHLSKNVAELLDYIRLSANEITETLEEEYPNSL